jgi:hypothetical protein
MLTGFVGLTLTGVIISTWTTTSLLVNEIILHYLEKGMTISEALNHIKKTMR